MKAAIKVEESSSAWFPLCDGEDRKQVMALVRDLSAALESNLDGAPSCDLTTGDPGFALLYAYLAAEPGADGDRLRGLSRRCIERAIGVLPASRNRPGLFGGWLGTAWAAQHLVSELWGSAEDPCEDIPGILCAQLRRGARGAHFDLISGLAGACVFAGERRSRDCTEILSLLVEEIGRQMRSQPEGLSLRTHPRNVADELRTEFPRGFFNAGVAHGIPGVITVLAQASAINVSGAGEVAKLLFRWFWARRLPDSVGSVFPQAFDVGSVPGPSRLAWCYGDPGVAAALWTASQYLEDPVMANAALEVARHSARRNPATSGVADAGLCHGSAGLQLIYQQFWVQTGEQVFLEAACYWLEQTLVRVRASGFPQEPGFLSGASGVGLALLAAVSERAPAWSSSLLVRTAERSG